MSESISVSLSLSQLSLTLTVWYRDWQQQSYFKPQDKQKARNSVLNQHHPGSTKFYKLPVFKSFKQDCTKTKHTSSKTKENIHMQVYARECRSHWLLAHQVERSRHLQRACRTETHLFGSLAQGWRLPQKHPEQVEYSRQWQFCHPACPECKELPRGGLRVHGSQESIPLLGHFAEWSQSWESNQALDILDIAVWCYRKTFVYCFPNPRITWSACAVLVLPDEKSKPMTWVRTITISQPWDPKLLSRRTLQIS